jgi:hypothetical protein
LLPFSVGQEFSLIQILLVHPHRSFSWDCFLV